MALQVKLWLFLNIYIYLYYMATKTFVSLHSAQARAVEALGVSIVDGRRSAVTYHRPLTLAMSAWN